MATMYKNSDHHIDENRMFDDLLDTQKKQTSSITTENEDK